MSAKNLHMDVPRANHLKVKALMVVFSILVGLAGCNLLFPNDSYNGPIYGNWQFSVPGNPDSFSMTLAANLTFTENYSYGSTANTFSGTYTNNGDSIVFTTTVFNGVPGPAQVANATYSVSPNGISMILTYQSGTPVGAPKVIPLAKS